MVEGYKKEDNYCTWSPDQIGTTRFNYGCYLHDRQYRNEVKKRKTRLQADQDLKNNIYKEFISDGKKHNIILRPYYYIMGFIVSRIYYFFVRLFASPAWVK